MVAKKGGSKAEDAVEDLARVPLQAILLADSFTTKFRPITLECPKVLLPLVNSPMIDYTLAWLESAGVEEVFVFCCSHSKQIINYLDKSNWVNQPNFSVTTIESLNCISAGDALRIIYERNVIQGDFILVSGDTVSNMMLTQALHEHKDRRRKDNNAVMTMVIKQSKPSQVTRQTRLGTDELIMAIDPGTKQLLYYEDKADDLKGTVTLDKAFLAENPSISLQNDKQDCYIDICTPEVLSLFTDNFDYQHLRRHFVKGLLLDDIMGYKIFTHEIHSSYAARIDNFRSYDSISKDIIQRWTYPLVPDVQFSINSAARLERHGIYRASDIAQSRSAQVGPFTYIGKGSTIGNNTVISNSVVGDGCKIGSNVSVDGCYIWHNVTIEDGCKLRHSILCDGVIMKSGAILEPGVVLSFKVVVGQEFVVPAYSKVSLLPQPVKQDSDEELEYADSNSGIISTTNTLENGDSTNDLSEIQYSASSDIGNGGRGFIWSISEIAREEDWRHSVAPIPAQKLIELTQAVYDDLEFPDQDDPLLPLADERESATESEDDTRDESQYFEREVEATFLRAVHENVKEDHIILEVNSLRLSHNMALENCASALFYSMMKLALDTPHHSATDLVKNTNDVISRWGKLLKPYLQGIDDEIEVILKFEEMCLESGKEYAPLFVQVLHLLYDKDIIQEEAILNWANEKEDADESDKVFVKQSEKFIQWLNEASEEED
ncbi:translation initiation factor eIF-2B subunit epsilon isoform X1 [Cynara cardunculus var. scolymus]|uniref:Translation initiation factor eIF2B subunit epsilon n=1 Tax=Cynara cardunculus var. scolymus TaxID=59895 RepID=A0A118JZI9_CYNCS|nr:translation initiation factor eIF-2B subunit epsilon isoform X1 [Cynara cardunculus var. scolymus]KVH99637.1 Armadillo-type fold [Cynara cardunculus var. scolymus]